MSALNQQDPNKFRLNYDNVHDVLYVYFGDSRVSYEDETAPGVFLRLSEDEDEITGFIIMDYKKKDEEVLRKNIPLNINFSDINKQIH